jgi:signal transduction histidine kinase
MTGYLFLDWLMMALSLFNTIIITWMGLAVLLNAERRAWGVWLTGGGLLAGGLFFVSHSALLGLDLHYVSAGMDFWWQIGWPLVIALPIAWYMVTLWYTGFWDDARSPLRRRQWLWMIATSALFAGLVGVVMFANPLPTYARAANLAMGNPFGFANAPLLFFAYAVYNVLCISLSLDALRSPAPSGRMMGDLARRRARPWLIAGSLSFLLVSLLLALVMLWLLVSGRANYGALALTIGVFDILLSALIAGAVMLIGQALVSYEVFTGKTLPRRGLYRQWRNVLILGAGIGALAGGSFALQLQPIYVLLLSTLLITGFYALFNWRSYAEREQYMEQLRPFISSQGLYEQLLARSAEATAEIDITAPFQALCADVLASRVAYLLPLGPMAPLAGPGLTYPPQTAMPALPVNELAARLQSPAAVCIPVEAGRHGGAAWAVPLWSERGLVGVLLLGDKRDGGLYAQEEMEIARASGERLLDTQASSEMARRLMALQRQRLAENQVLDQRARRVLHDDVLPRVHAAMLSLSGSANGNDAMALLAGAHREISNLLREIATTAAPEVARLGLIGALRRVTEADLASAFDGVTWNVDAGAEGDLRGLPPLTAEVIFYAAREAMRNAARHGRSAGNAKPLHLRLSASCADHLTLTIEDDGVGLRLDSAAATDGGSGQGLALHSTMMAVIGGSLAVESQAGAYTRVMLSLPHPEPHSNSVR